MLMEEKVEFEKIMPHTILY